ncbi:hypothetical protein FACS1894140_5220 [Spirochaetia bacterium]|nr:hypothetical protein FACS1894140_5220 [Spirochaetia bacterium]
MAFCSNCGTQVAKGVKFCTSCGTPIGGATAAPTAKSAKEKLGNVRVCPNCGETIGSVQARCPSCGHELNSAAVAGGIKEFTDKLQKTGDSKKREQLIANFPIPNSKEDLLEFAILVSSKLKQEPSLYQFAKNGFIWDGDHESWKAKWDQVLQKIKLVLAGDKEVQEVVLGMKNDLAEFEKHWIREGKKHKGKENAKKGCALAIVPAIAVAIVAAIVVAVTQPFAKEFAPVTIPVESINLSGVFDEYFDISEDGLTLQSAKKGKEVIMTVEFIAVKSPSAFLEQQITTAIKARGWTREQCVYEIEEQWTARTYFKLGNTRSNTNVARLILSLWTMEKGTRKKISVQLRPSSGGRKTVASWMALNPLELEIRAVFHAINSAIRLKTDYVKEYSSEVEL